MPTVRLFHWKAAEAEPLIESLRVAGYEVDYPGDRFNGNFRSIREQSPHALVIDLTRMPSHGRYVAAALRATKSARHIPLVFVDGPPEKVDRLKVEFPDANFSSRSKLLAVLKKVKPVQEPVAAPHVLSNPARTTAQKLGIKENARVAVVDPPAEYLQIVGDLPSGVLLEEDTREVCPLTLWFVTELDDYHAGLRRMRQRAAVSRIWVIYPKLQAKAKKGGRNQRRESAAGLNQNLIRAAALGVGMVDYKICSLNEVWSGMLFTVKK